MIAMAAIGCGTHHQSTPTADGLAEAVSVETQSVSRRSRKSQFKQSLSEYDLFREPLGELQPAAEVIEYDLNTPLFSDYSQKQRLVRLPRGTSATYRSQGPLEFPIGTIIAKTFYYANDLNDDTGKRRLIETRILEHREDGWTGIPYLWNEDQTDASLAIAGAAVDVSWKHTDGAQRTNTHVVPNVNDCKRCHANPTMQPIGPKANNLNRDFGYDEGTENQLAYWSRSGIVSGLPQLIDIPRLAVWHDEASGTIDERARAYLEVNCAHCHNPIGPARNSGLHLNIEATDPYRLGVFKTPVAAGRGTGGRLYGIVPGRPDESIMDHRMRTVTPGEVMPEFGRSLIHEEGLALIRQWITEIE
ncbi:MAG: hypothetical protein KDB11_22375 [Planctomycetales bacterium]|nr:hypothetical protein [Planctomycetales bacterium]